jgi:hypothetical protein
MNKRLKQNKLLRFYCPAQYAAIRPQPVFLRTHGVPMIWLPAAKFQALEQCTNDARST